MIDTTDRPWLEVGLISLMMSVPVTLMVWLSTALIFWREPLHAAQLLHFFLPVLIITLIMTAINFVMARRSPVETHRHDDQDPTMASSACSCCSSFLGHCPRRGSKKAGEDSGFEQAFHDSDPIKRMKR